MLKPSNPKAVTGNELVFPLPGGPATTIIRARVTQLHPVSSVVSESGNMSGGRSLDTSLPSASKWQAPTFVYQGNLASFFPKSKQHASLMFHTGAQIPGNHPLLTGGGDTSRVMKLGSMAEANAAKRDIERLVRAWCDFRDSSAKGTTTTRARKSKSTGKASTKAAKTASKRKARAKA